MVNLTNHTADNRIVLLLNNLRDLVKTQGLEGTLLIYGITDLTDLALNLLNLNCCHSSFSFYPLNTLSILMPRVPAMV